MSARTRLKVATSTEQPRSPEREALRVARARYDAALTEERELEHALVAVRETRRRSQAALAKAQNGANEAKTAMAMRAAREAIQQHEDELEACKHNEATARQALFELRLPLTRMRFESALAAAIGADTATAALFREFDAVAARFVELVRAIEVLSGEMIPLDRRDAFFRGPGLSYRLSVTELLANTREVSSPLVAQWKAALAALASDPDAELPLPG